MKNLSLKLDEKVFKETEEMIEQLKVPRNRYINTALRFYNSYQSKQLLKRKLQQESMLVRKDSMKILKDMELLEDEF
jgi:metal-responsive CopG/Arc/MetJ family transcriptional regulator